MPALLRTKLFVPRPHRGSVRRHQLLGRLDACAEGVLTIVSAPAGYGKTSIVSGWIHDREIEAGWYSVDADDDDPGRFWSYLLEALGSVAPGLGQPALELLNAPLAPSPDTIASVVVNEIAGLERPIVCVIDEYHHIEAKPIHDGLIFLVENAPPDLHVILTTRSDPPWPLGRLRAERRVAELRAADLRFDEGEAAELLGAAGLALSGRGVRQLEERTDGWVAGLQMAALSMRDRDDAEAFIDDFAGSHRFILDYLTEEVLSRQTDEVLRFLVRTSILDRLEGDLCDAVTASTGGAEMLRSLERANLFTDALDDERHWYRYHPLLADVLQARLRAAEPATESELHERAAAWFEAHDLADEAVRHALEAGNADRAARLISRIASATFMVGSQTRFLAWLDRLPDEVVAREPTLALEYAWARFVIGDLDGIDEVLTVAADAIGSIERSNERGALATQLDAMRAWILYQQGDLDGCIELARRTIKKLPADGLVPRRLISAALGAALTLQGEPDEARLHLESTRVESHRASDRLTESLALAILAQLELTLDRLEAAGRASRQAIEVGTVAGEPLPSVGIASVLLGEVLRAQHDLAEAETVLESAIAICERAMGLPEWVFEGYVSLARVVLATGDRGRANTLVARADELFETEIVPGGMEPLVQRAVMYRRAFESQSGAARRTADGHGTLIEPLSDRELAVLSLMADGRSNQEIADELYLSVNTVKWHARNLFGKLGVSRRTQAVERARELGIR